MSLTFDALSIEAGVRDGLRAGEEFTAPGMRSPDPVTPAATASSRCSPEELSSEARSRARAIGAQALVPSLAMVAAAKVCGEKSEKRSAVEWGIGDTMDSSMEEGLGTAVAGSRGVMVPEVGIDKDAGDGVAVAKEAGSRLRRGCVAVLACGVWAGGLDVTPSEEVLCGRSRAPLDPSAPGGPWACPCTGRGRGAGKDWARSTDVGSCGCGSCPPCPRLTF